MNIYNVFFLTMMVGVNIVTQAVKRPPGGPQLPQPHPVQNIPFQYTRQPPPVFSETQNAYNFARVPFSGNGPMPMNPNHVREGYLQHPAYESLPKMQPWCNFPYHCGTGQLCPQQPICPAQRHCCRSLVGMCCFSPSDRSPPQYPPPMPHNKPFFPEPSRSHYPLPEHRIPVSPPADYKPIIYRPPPPAAHPYSPLINHPPPLHPNNYMPNTTPVGGSIN